MGSNQNAMETNTAFPHSCYAAVQQMSGSTAELTPSTAVCCVAVLCAVLLSGSTARMAAAVRSPQDRPGTQHSRGVAVKKGAHHRAPLQRNHPRRRRSPTPLPRAGRGSGARPPPPPPPSLSSAAAELTAAAAELREVRAALGPLGRVGSVRREGIRAVRAAPCGHRPGGGRDGSGAVRDGRHVGRAPQWRRGRGPTLSREGSD